MIRRYGDAPVWGQKYRARPGVYAVLRRGSEVLLTLQQAPEPEFQLPGGGVDAGEHPIAALHREVFEETGWAISTPRRLGIFRRHAYMPEYDIWAEKICTIYVARPTLRRGPPLEQGHHAVWLPAQEAADVVYNPGDREFLLAAMRLPDLG